MNMTNYNPETRTHYGCIRLNELEDGIVDQIYDLDRGPDLCYEDNYLDESHLEGVQATIDDVTFEVFLLGGAYHLLIVNSPFVDYTRPCSPCVPNAGDLTSPDPQGIRTYSVPPTWL
jgi:hypothetical protein